MRTVLVGAFVACVTAICLWPHTSRDQAFAQAPPMAQAADGSLLALALGGNDQSKQVVIVDPRKRAISVYQIDSQSGAIELQSVRRIEWDLDMMQFNAAEPLPQEIRTFLEQSR